MLTDVSPSVGGPGRTVLDMAHDKDPIVAKSTRGRRPEGDRRYGVAAAAIVITLASAAAAVAVNLGASEPSGTGAGQLTAVESPVVQTPASEPATPDSAQGATTTDSVGAQSGPTGQGAHSQDDSDEHGDHDGDQHSGDKHSGDSHDAARHDGADDDD